MNFEELLKYLHLESPEEMTYFENIADLFEADENIPSEALYQLFSEADMDTVAGLISDYFEEMTDHFPEDELELFTLINGIKMALTGMARHIDEENDMVIFSEEFDRFHTWYSIDSEVSCTPENDDEAVKMPLRDALAVYRLERFGEEKYSYDFSECLDFEMDEYTMTFVELFENDSEEYDDYDGYDSREEDGGYADE